MTSEERCFSRYESAFGVLTAIWPDSAPKNTPEWYILARQDNITHKVPLKSNMTMQVLDTAEVGKTLWSGEIHYEDDLWGRRAKADRKLVSLFHRAVTEILPTRVQGPDGISYFGTLQPIIADQNDRPGTLVLKPYTQNADNLSIEHGSHIRIFHRVEQGRVAWSGKLAFDEASNEPLHMTSERWAEMCANRHNPVLILGHWRNIYDLDHSRSRALYINGVGPGPLIQTGPVL